MAGPGCGRGAWLLLLAFTGSVSGASRCGARGLGAQVVAQVQASCFVPAPALLQPPRRARALRLRGQMPLRGCDGGSSALSTPPWRPQLGSPVLVLVGSPGAGKRSLARGLAQRLDIGLFDCLDLPSEAEAGVLEGVFRDAQGQARGLAAVVTSTGANAGPVRAALEKAKAQGHLIVQVQRSPTTAGDAAEEQPFHRVLSSHRFCVLDDAGSHEHGAAQLHQWERMRSLELAVDDLHVMAHRLVYSPPVLLLGSTIEPIPEPLLSAPHTLTPLAYACASDVVQLRADLWRDSFLRRCR